MTISGPGMASLRRKITLGHYAIGPLAVGILAVLGLRAIEVEGLGGEHVAALLDATMEARRFEKNFFLYHHDKDLAEARRYAGEASALLREQAALPERFLGAEERRTLEDGLANYIGLLDQAAAGARRQQVEPNLRLQGKILVDAVERMLARERHAARDYLDLERGMLVIFAGLLALLVVGVGRWLRGAVIRPLAALEDELIAIAAGSTRAIVPPSQDREVVSLAGAINRLLVELEDRQRHLLFTEKLASLGTLVSGVAHELNNPLSNISTSCQILQEEQATVDPTDVRRLLAQIDGQVERAQRIVRLLLEYARRRDLEVAPVVMADLVSDTLLLLKTEIPSAASIVTRVSDGLTVKADRHRLQQVLLNLLRNAIDAVGEAGAVSLSARLLSKGAEACAPGCAAPTNQMVEIRVEDDGPGIPVALRSQVFDPFFSTKPMGKGTGLGLFIAYEIIQQHGGCIGLDETVSSGTAFVVRLPAADLVPGLIQKVHRPLE